MRERLTVITDNIDCTEEHTNSFSAYLRDRCAALTVYRGDIHHETAAPPLINRSAARGSQLTKGWSITGIEGRPCASRASKPPVDRYLAPPDTSTRSTVCLEAEALCGQTHSRAPETRQSSRCLARERRNDVHEACIHAPFTSRLLAYLNEHPLVIGEGESLGARTRVEVVKESAASRILVRRARHSSPLPS